MTYCTNKTFSVLQPLGYEIFLFPFFMNGKKMNLSNVPIQVCLRFAISCLFTISFAFSSQQPEYPGLYTKLSNIIFLFWVLEDHQIRKKMTNMRLYRPQKLL